MLKWTNEPPTKPGYYLWKAYVNAEPMLVLLGYFRSLDTQLSVIWPQGNVTGVQYANRMGGQWAIPRKGNADEMDK